MLVAAFAIDAGSAVAPARSFFPTQAVWTLELNNQLTAAPAFAANAAYFPIDGERIAAYEIASGRQLWIAPLGTKLQPAVGDDLLFVVCANDVIALHQEDGSEAWRQPFTDSIAIPPVWDNHWLIVADTSGRVRAFRAHDGRLIWQTNVGAQLHARPALAADRVYVPTVDDRLAALSVETGAIAWERRLGGTPNDILALDERLYVGATDNFLYCVKAAQGEIAWRWRTGGDIAGRPIADKDHVYFVSFDNVLRALNLRSGTQAWKRALPFRPIAGPLQVSNTVLVPGLQPPVHGFAVKDGTPVNDITITGELAAPPSIIDIGSGRVPVMIIVTRDIAKGATATEVTGALDPPLLPIIQLPSAVLPKPAPPKPVSAP